MKTQKIVLVVLLGFTAAGCDMFTSTETRLARAEKQMAASDYGAALIEIKNVLQKEPDNARAHLDLAQVVMQLGDVSHAAQELKRALELAAGRPFPKGQGAPDPVELDARIRLASGKAADVLADIDSGKRVMAPAPRSLYRGLALLALNRIPEAHTAFQEAIKADPKSTRAAVGLAQTYANQGDVKRALETLDAALVHQPNSAEAWIAKGIILAATRRGPGAEKALEKANANASQLTLEQQARLLATLSNAKLRRGDIEGAQKLYDSLVSFSGEAPMTRLLAAQIAIARKDYEAANAELQRLLRGTPDFLPARIMLGDVLIKQSRFEQAEQHLSQAVAKAPQNAQARQLLSQVNKQLGRPDPEPPPASAAQDRKRQVDPRLIKAMQYQRSGDKAKAIAEYEQLLATYPKNAGVMNNLAWLYYETGDKRALETARKAYELVPKIPEVSDTYGWILFKAGRREEALKILKAAAAASKNPEIQKHYAEAQSSAK